MIVRTDTPDRHRAALNGTVELLRELFAEVMTVLEEAEYEADAGLGCEHAPEGRALVSLTGAAQRVVEALEDAKRSGQSERLVEASIRAGRAVEAIQGRLAGLTSLADLAREEADRRDVAADFGEPVVRSAQLLVATPTHGLSCVRIAVDARGAVEWSGGDLRLSPVDERFQLAVGNALGALSEILNRALEANFPVELFPAR